MQREKFLLEPAAVKNQERYVHALRNRFEELNRLEGRKPLAFTCTWGCQMNEHDTENLEAMLYQMGFEMTQSEEQADLIIYNTCAVRENAELKVYGNLHFLKKYKEKNPNLIIAVCGCMMQQEHVVREIKSKYKHVSLVFGTHNLYCFPELLSEYLEQKQSIFDVWDIDGKVVEGLPLSPKFDVKAFVNIMYGCNNFCTYCVVPLTRGRERSREKEDILSEIQFLVDSGVKEVTLLGQNVNSYGNTLDADYSFADLLRDIDTQVTGLERLRFMTSHPKDLSDEVIAAVAELRTVCESIHLPVQSGSSRILREMNRHYTKESYLSLVAKIKNKIPNVTLTTDIMVGFPGETEEDFADTLDVVRDVRFDTAFTFLYSVRVGTKAEKMEDQIPEQIKKERFQRLLDVLNPICAESNREYVGREVEVLVEGRSKKDAKKMTGRTRENKLVNFSGDDSMIGQLKTVHIDKSHSFSLSGTVIK